LDNDTVLTQIVREKTNGGDVRVEFVWIGEGWSGEYDETNPDDEPLVRIDVLESNPGEVTEYVDDGSVCTRIVADENSNYERSATEVMDKVFPVLDAGERIKKIMEKESRRTS